MLCYPADVVWGSQVFELCYEARTRPQTVETSIIRARQVTVKCYEKHGKTNFIILFIAFKAHRSKDI